MLNFRTKPWLSRIGALALLLAMAPFSGAQVRPAPDTTAPVAWQLSARDVLRSPVARVPALATGVWVSVIDSAEIRSAHAESLSELLQARLPGLSVLRSGGSLGDASRVHLRGPTSFIANTEPVVYVDGVRVIATQDTFDPTIGTSPSRLDDFAPEDIERIEVLRGPAATALFGSGAVNGVIAVSTKRGGSGPLRWSGGGEWGLVVEPTNFPANYRREGVSSGGTPVTRCTLVAQARGQCTPTRLDVWNPLEQASRFRTGRLLSGNASVSGSVDETQLFVGGTARSDLGVRDDDRRQRVTARATAGRQFTNQFDAQATVGVTWREHQLPFQGNLVFPVNLLDAGLFGDAVNDTSHGYLPNVDASTAEARQKTNHVTGSIGVHWQPASWLRAAGVGGLDRVDVDNSELQHSPFQPPSLRERAIAETENEATYTLGFEAAANYRAWALFAAQTALGFDYRRTHLSSESLAGPPGAPSQFRSVVMNSRSKGFWARQTLLWRERVAIDGGLRWSGADAFGASQPSDLHKSLSASWLVGATSARSVRLRAAYGDATGDLPRDALVFIAPQPFGDAIDPLRAERTSEEELGLDAALDHGIDLALTAFRATSSRVMLDVALPPSNGFPSTVVRNVGRMRNTGVEALARVRLVDRSSFRWNASLSFATLRNRVLSLDGVPPLIAATYRIQAGYPVRGLWSLPYTYSDANRDGIVDTSEVQLGAERVVRGAPFPTREAALRSRMSFPAGFGLDAVLDYRGGYALENLNESFRCRAVFNCRATNDPSTPLVDQARAAAALKGARSYIQDASFLKLREVTARWSVPASWTRAMRASAIELSVAARDAGTWTDYDGLDPEITALGTEELPRSDFSKQPITRRFVLRIDIDGALR